MRKATWKQGEKDLKLVELVGSMEIKAVALELEISEDAVRGRLKRLRERLNNYRWLINNIQAKGRRNSRVRKFTTIGRIPEDVD